MSIKNDGHYFCRAGGNRPDGLNEPVTDDLVRPFYLLEGRNVPDFRSSIGAQYGEFLGNGDNVGKLLEGEYFTVRGYQKGTVHIVFKRSDLVEKLNDIIARHYPGALPPRV